MVEEFEEEEDVGSMSIRPTTTTTTGISSMGSCMVGDECGTHSTCMVNQQSEGTWVIPGRLHWPDRKTTQFCTRHHRHRQHPSTSSQSVPLASIDPSTRTSGPMADPTIMPHHWQPSAGRGLGVVVAGCEIEVECQLCVLAQPIPRSDDRAVQYRWWNHRSWS